MADERTIDFQGTIQFRRGLQDDWQTLNPILEAGEMGVEVDTQQFKIGDGVSNWTNLPYGGLRGGQGIKGDKGDKGDIGDVTPEAQTARDQATAAAAAALASQNAAANSASSAQTNASTASTKATAASNSANTAQGYAQEASDSAQAASQDAIMATQKATQAAASADAAATTLTTALKKANNLNDVADVGETRKNLGLGTTGPQGDRNWFLNCGPSVWQKPKTIALNNNTLITADLWYVGSGTNGAATVTQGFHAATDDGRSRMFININKYQASTTEGTISQKLEYVTTLAGKQVTLSFDYDTNLPAGTNLRIWVRQNFGTGGSATVDTTMGNITVGGQKSLTFTIPSIAGKTLGTEDTHYVEIFIATPASVVHTFSIWDMCIEQGAVKTPTVRRKYTQELDECLRWLFYISGNSGYMPCIVTGNTTSVMLHFGTHMMRKQATLNHNLSHASFVVGETNANQWNLIMAAVGYLAVSSGTITIASAPYATVPRCPAVAIYGMTFNNFANAMTMGSNMFIEFNTLYTN